MQISTPPDMPPRCPKCDASMTCIGELPSVIDRPFVAVFRCKQCNAIVTQEG